MLYQFIQEAQAGNQKAMLYLLEKFDPLLRKYSRRLRAEDSYQTMQLKFLELIQQINLNCLRNHLDAVITRYISTTLHHAYIQLSKANERIENHEYRFTDMSEEQRYHLQNSCASIDSYQELLRTDLTNILSKQEFQILLLIYIDGYSAADIARHFHTTRQNINQIKLRALRKLRNSFLREI